MAALATAPVRLSTTRLREQAHGAPAAAASPRRAGAARVVIGVGVATAALLLTSAALPAGTGTGEASASPASTGAMATEDGTAGGPALLPRTGATTTTAPETAGSPARAPRTSCVAPCSTSQVVSVTVLPGPLALSVAPGPVVVRVGRDGVGHGVVSGLRVTDLRGVGAGWSLTARVGSVVDELGRAVTAAAVEVVPACRLVAGPLTLQTAGRSSVAAGSTASLCRVPVAANGSSAGGVVEAHAALIVRGARPGAELHVELDTSLT